MGTQTVMPASRGKLTDHAPTAYDTVEAFWDATVLERLRRTGAAADPEEFAERFRETYGLTGTAVLTDSARTALTVYLRALRTDAPGSRTTVLVSAFNCQAVKDSVHAAGLRVRTYDLAGADGGFDGERIADGITTDCLAVVVPHLFGVPVRLGALSAACADRGVALIEDCSQAVGAAVDGRPAGTFGDAAVFSFGHDKPLSLGGGGLLLLRDGTAVPRPARGTHAGDAVLLDALLTFLDRRRRMVLDAGNAATGQERASIYARSAEAPATMPVGPLRAALGSWQLDHYSAARRARHERALLVAARTRHSWPVPPGAAPAWLKQKVLLPGRVEEVTARMQRQGVRAGPFNWHRALVADLPGPRTRYAALWSRQAIDVPVHQRLPRPRLLRALEEASRDG
jgi:hypothetical protein